jgi:predicted RNA binding protein YcfA (HicA-like mRNA interferase family)
MILTPRQAVNRAVFRGARVERRTRHHVTLRRGARRTTVPLFGDVVPRGTIRRIERDLGIDLQRPIRLCERSKPLA